MRSAEPNPYASPQVANARPAAEERRSAWSNRLATAGFVLSLMFPLLALASLAALFLEDEFGVPRWRVHRAVRMVLFFASISSLASLIISLAGLTAAPRRLALYGAVIGTLGSAYLALALVGIVRR